MSNIPPHRRPVGAVRSKSKKSSVKEKPVNENDANKKTGLIVAAILIPVLLLGAGTLFFLTSDGSKNNVLSFVFSSSSPEKEEIQVEKETITAEAEADPVVEEETETVATEAEVAEPAPVEETVTSEKAYSGSAGKYSIIVGSFNEESNAIKLKRKIENTGNPVIVLPGSNFFRVSVAEFNDWSSASSSLNNYRSKYNQDAWILANK